MGRPKSDPSKTAQQTLQALPCLNLVPDSIPEQHIPVILHLAMGHNSFTTAEITGYTPEHTRALHSQYRQEIQAIAAAKQTVILALAERTLYDVMETASQWLRKIKTTTKQPSPKDLRDVASVASALHCIQRDLTDRQSEGMGLPNNAKQLSHDSSLAVADLQALGTGKGK